MKIDINNVLTICSLLFMIVGNVYRLAKIESSINARIGRVETDVLCAIDKLKDSFVDRFYSVEKKLDVHIQDYINYKDVNEKLNQQWTKQQNFKIRE